MLAEAIVRHSTDRRHQSDSRDAQLDRREESVLSYWDKKELDVFSTNGIVASFLERARRN